MTKQPTHKRPFGVMVITVLQLFPSLGFAIDIAALLLLDEPSLPESG